MKRIFALALILALFCLPAGAQTAATPRPMVNGTDLIDGTHPLPTTSTITTATSTPIYTDEYGPTNGTCTVILLTSTGQGFTHMANLRHITLISTGTFKYRIGSTTALTNVPLIYDDDFDCTPEMVVGFWTTATPTYLAIQEATK